VHIGFLIKKLTLEEIESRVLDIPEKDSKMFPKEGVLFFIESFDEYYGCHIKQNRGITGLDDWFEGYPVKQNDTIIISKYSEGYYLIPLSEIVDQQQHFNLEMERILLLEPEDVLCPNCRYKLEHAGLGSTEDSYILKCARCGFTLVKKSHFD